MTDKQLEEISERIARKYESKEDKHNCGPWYRSALQDFIKETEAFYERDLDQARAELEGVTKQRDEAVKLGKVVLDRWNSRGPSLSLTIALNHLDSFVSEYDRIARSAEGARGD